MNCFDLLKNRKVKNTSNHKFFSGHHVVFNPQNFGSIVTKITFDNMYYMIVSIYVTAVAHIFQHMGSS